MTYNLTHIVLKGAADYPDREAFKCGTSSVTYGELESKTRQLAFHLKNKGVKKGDRVGIYMYRCIETPIAVYGIMRAGAVFVPLDPLAPNKRTAQLVKECSIVQLCTIPSLRKKITALSLQLKELQGIVGIDPKISTKAFSWDSIFELETQDYQEMELLGDDLAYVMFTSGSTGTPKGIMHTHFSALSYAQQSAWQYQVSKNDRTANHAPLHFDICTFGYFASPYAGATTVIIPDAHTKIPASLSALMESEKITIWYSVPRALIELLDKGVLDQRDLGSLRWVKFGGEVFPIKYLIALMEKWPHSRFSNVYGPAEINQCTYYHISEIPDKDFVIPLGRVWNNADFKILDEEDKPAATGASGELVVRTATMMHGYWKNPSLTQKSLYTAKNNAGIEEVYYRTGDTVTKDGKNTLFFLGRNDRQIKLRGYRVELDEVEHVLVKHPEVKEAVAIVCKDERGESYIAGAVTLNEPFEENEKQLLHYCKGQLPPYAVPKLIGFVQEFPRTTSGKIKRTDVEKFVI